MTLECLANIASIATAVAAGGAWAYYFVVRHKKRVRLEDYLREAKAGAKGDKKGQRSVIHLMANCGMSEADVLEAAFRSRHIKPRVVEDEKTGLAVEILLEYQPDANSN